MAPQKTGKTRPGLKQSVPGDKSITILFLEDGSLQIQFNRPVEPMDKGHPEDCQHCGVEGDKLINVLNLSKEASMALASLLNSKEVSAFLSTDETRINALLSWWISSQCVSKLLETSSIDPTES